MEKEYDAFISYQSEDGDWAVNLAESLETTPYEDRRLKVFLDKWDIKPGDDIVERINHGLANSRFVVLVLSPSYLGAAWPTAERNAAIFKDPAGKLGHVIPVLYRKCTLPPLLQFRKYVDFTPDKFESGLASLRAIIKQEPLPRGKHHDGHSVVQSDESFAVRHLDAALPDEVEDELYPNLFSVSLPKKVWSAPTALRTYKEIRGHYPDGRVVPPYFIWKQRLYTFAKLSADDHPFIGITDDYDLSADDVDNWLNDPDKCRRLAWLLNDCIRAHTQQLGMSYYKPGEKHYFEEGVLKDTRFKLYGKGRGKDLIIDYTKGGTTRGIKAFRALKMRFLVIGLEPFLRVDTGWVFKSSMGNIIAGRRATSLNVKFQSTQRNAPNFSEIRFMTWLLSNDKDRISFWTGGEPVDVDIQPIPVQIRGGVFGDQRLLKPVAEPPELTFEGDADGTEFGEPAGEEEGEGSEE